MSPNSGERPLCSSLDTKLSHDCSRVRSSVPLGGASFPSGTRSSDVLHDRPVLGDPGAVVVLCQSGVQDRTHLAQYNVCRLVDRLEREALVERCQCELDGRNNVLVITSKGRALRRAMRPVYASAVQEHLGARLSQAIAEQLLRVLSKLALR